MLHKKLRLIGYLRTGGTNLGIDAQKQQIEEFCREHQHTLCGFSAVDEGEPALGLAEVLQALHDFDGIIATDLNRFVKHHEDRLADLRPLIVKMMHQGKVLITINEQLETQTADGQFVTLQLLDEWSDRESTVMPPIHEHADISNY
ncbi:MAG: recombinase family protein [Candidatus Obscuribacterales bacterium]